MESLVPLKGVEGLNFLRKRGAKILWIGAASFEERSINSLLALSNSDIRIEKAIVISYKTRVEPEPEAGESRRANMAEILRLAAKVSRTQSLKKPLPAYAYGAAFQFVTQQLSDVEYDLIIFDVSCLTKIHAIAVAAALGLDRGRCNAIIAYTSAENYPGIADSDVPAPGWQDIIVAPLSASARFFNESSSRGIVILGHEADRLIVALAEIEPSGGAIVVASSPLRPDIGELTARRNARVVRQLMRMRAADWTKHTIGLMDVRGMEELVSHEIQRASKDNAPAILFPYGPKTLLFISAFSLAKNYYDNSWFVYPIPMSYDSSYSEGIGELMWLRLAR